MDIQQLDAALIRKAFLAAASELESNKDWINELNVFPVPDGDTGTNMTLTIMTAAQDVAALDEGRPEALQDHLIRVSSRCPRKLRRHSFPAPARFYEGDRREG